MTTEALVCDLRVVRLDFVEGAGSVQHIVQRDELANFIIACRKLHNSPGVNPHVTNRDNRTTKVWRISVAPFQAHGPFWWAQTELGVAPSAGAYTYREGVFQTVFRDAELAPQGP